MSDKKESVLIGPRMTETVLAARGPHVSYHEIGIAPLQFDVGLTSGGPTT